MLSFSLLFCVALAISNAKPVSDDLQKMQESHEACLKEIGIEKVDLHKVLESKIPEEVLEKYSFCYGKKFGYIGGDNKIDLIVAKDQFEKIIPGTTEQFMKACIPEGEVTEKKALEIQRCIVNKTKELSKQ
ncbi:uncharacterized protein LOC130900385 [Diorhabda carinulata]|uniref:uncharacterized protein LOC130452359 n=1 Tax=Diorhabda sublineata TaxID=1163346 RepID=UPI0024E0C070|nr:uncharacterized protein LOC130452359 [Diorhabda sublineata]XP_057666919.1 uncharacterized protein LOC130900385 [Diorhabda carinulata]